MTTIATVWFIIQTLWYAIGCAIAYALGSSRCSCIVRLADSLARINVFYVKVLQILASSTTLLTEHEASAITRYSDRVPFADSDVDHAWYETLDRIATQTPGLTVDVGNNGRPVFAGTVAVVYEGDMQGKKVAIKVLRRGVETALRKAFSEFDALLRLLGYVFSLQHLNLTTILQDNQDALLAQTDFPREVESQVRMSRNFRHVDYVWIPHVYRAFTDADPRMIVMDYVEGCAAANVAEKDRDEYAVLFARCVSKCVLYDRFFHADLHAGNVRFVERSGEKSIALLDFGLMGEMTREEQDAMYRAHGCFIAKDWTGVAQTALDRFVEPQHVVERLSPTDRDTLVSTIADVVAMPESANMSPRALFTLSTALSPFDLSLARSFSRMQLALCASSSVHASLGMTLDFREAMEKAAEVKNAWEF
jgi:predicted unusual protein kinase regulating ubiquinone biosynthesis (AarF/ABC1/UbiB family)